VRINQFKYRLLYSFIYRSYSGIPRNCSQTALSIHQHQFMFPVYNLTNNGGRSQKVITVRQPIPLRAGHVVVLSAMSPKQFTWYDHVATTWPPKSCPPVRRKTAWFL